MSYVLDALEKTEQERVVGTVPNAGDIGRGPVRSSRRVGWLMLFVGVGLLLAGGVYMGLGDRAEKPVVARPEASRAPVVAQEERVLTVSAAPPAPVAAPPAPVAAPPAPVAAPPVPVAAPPAPMAAPPVPVAAPVKQPDSGSARMVQPSAPAPASGSALSLSRTLSPAATVTAPVVVTVPTTSNQARFTARVAGVIDGCTIEVKNQKNYLQKVQMFGIACLPPQSLAGKEARLFTTHALFTQNVVIIVLKEEANHVLVAEVFDREGAQFNRALVRQGFVNATDERFQMDEQEARLLHRGLWQNPGVWGSVVPP